MATEKRTNRKKNTANHWSKQFIFSKHELIDFHFEMKYGASLVIAKTFLFQPQKFAYLGAISAVFAPAACLRFNTFSLAKANDKP